MTATLLALAALFQAPMDEDLPAPISLTKMPVKVERLMHRLRIDDELIPEEIAAGNKDCCRPYYPLMVMDDVGLKKSQGRKFFMNFYLPRHWERSPAWLKAGRLDLIAESMVVVARGDGNYAHHFAMEWSPIIENLLRKKGPEVVKAKLGDKEKERWSDAEKRFELLDQHMVKYLADTLAKPQYQAIATAPLVTFQRYPGKRAPYGNIDTQSSGLYTAILGDRLESGGQTHQEWSLNIRKRSRACAFLPLPLV